MTSAETSGIWCAEFVTNDLKINPTGGPIEPYYHKSMLFQSEDSQEGKPQDAPTFRSLGKFNVADAEVILKQFEKASLRFEINRDDDTMRQMMPIMEVTGGYSGTATLIEIFVSAEDEARAVEIMSL